MSFRHDKFVIFGAGCFGREVGSMIESEGLGEVSYAHQVSDVIRPNGQIELHKWISEEEYDPALHGVPVVTTGNSSLRKKIADSIRSKHPGVSFPVIVSKKAHIGQRVHIGEGTIVTANCIVTCDVIIGTFVNLNLATTVGHDVKLGDYVTTAPGVHINGNVRVGSNTYFGSNSATVEDVNIVDDVILGAGAVVSKDIDKQGTYVGVPAKLLRR